MKTLGLAGALLALAGSANAHTQDWVLGSVASTSAQAYDQLAVEVSGNLRSTWVMFAHREAMGGGEFPPYDYTLNQTTFDCSGSRARFTGVKVFQIGRVEPIDTIMSVGPWFNIGADTVGDDTLQLICSNERHEALDYKSTDELAVAIRAGLRERDN